MTKRFSDKTMLVIFITLYVVAFTMGLILIAYVSKTEHNFFGLYLFLVIFGLCAFQSQYVLLRDNESDILKKQDLPFLIVITLCTIATYIFKYNNLSAGFRIPVIIIWAIFIVANFFTQGYRYNTKIWRWNIVDAIKNRKNRDL